MRKYLLILFSIIALSCARPLELSSGATYYVATNGSDGNNGTSTSTPWATWQKAFSTAVAGDIVYIRGGTYQPTSTYGYGNYNGVYITSKNGTLGSPITIENYPGEVPVLMVLT